MKITIDIYKWITSKYLALDQTTPQTTVGTFTFPEVVVKTANQELTIGQAGGSSTFAQLSSNSGGMFLKGGVYAKDFDANTPASLIIQDLAGTTDSGIFVDTNASWWGYGLEDGSLRIFNPQGKYHFDGGMYSLPDGGTIYAKEAEFGLVNPLVITYDEIQGLPVITSDAGGIILQGGVNCVPPEGDNNSYIYAYDANLVTAFGFTYDILNEQFRLEAGGMVSPLFKVGTSLVPITSEFNGLVNSMGSASGFFTDLGLNSYDDGFTTVNTPCGFKADAYGLPIVNIGLNFSQHGGNQDRATGGYLGSAFRLDNREIYPFFQLMYQPADESYTEYTPLAVTTSGKVLAGNGWNSSNVGTYNDEDLQAFDRAYVGTELNVSSGTVLGAEKLTNGAFTGSSTGWILGTGWRYNTNLIRKDINGTGELYQPIANMVTPLVNGEVYEVTFTSSSRTAGGFNVYCGGVFVCYIASNATVSYRFRCIDDSAALSFIPTTDATRIYVDTVSLKRVIYTGGTVNSSTIASNNSTDLLVKTGIDKTMVLEETVWDDFPASPIISAKLGSTAPTLATFVTDVEQFTFDATNDYVIGTTEIPHNWKEGTVIYPHIHWATNGTNATDRGVQWQLKWTVGDGMETFSSQITSVIDVTIPLATADRYHFISEFGTTMNGANLKIGAIICWRLDRIATAHANGGPANDPFALSIGFHGEMDTVGSRQRFIK